MAYGVDSGKSIQNSWDIVRITAKNNKVGKKRGDKKKKKSMHQKASPAKYGEGLFLKKLPLLPAISHARSPPRPVTKVTSKGQQEVKISKGQDNGSGDDSNQTFPFARQADG